MLLGFFPNVDHLLESLQFLGMFAVEQPQVIAFHVASSHFESLIE